eukprot:COSAG01_NODE_1431_length_10324_cov_23.953154_1_plen_121_part_00
MADAPPLPAHEEELVLERGALVEIRDGDNDSEPVGRAIVEHVYPRACMCNPLAGERFWCPAPGMRHIVYELHVYADEDADGDCDWADPNAWGIYYSTRFNSCALPRAASGLNFARTASRR